MRGELVHLMGTSLNLNELQANVNELMTPQPRIHKTECTLPKRLVPKWQDKRRRLIITMEEEKKIIYEDKFVEKESLGLRMPPQKRTEV